MFSKDNVSVCVLVNYPFTNFKLRCETMLLGAPGILPFLLIYWVVVTRL